MQFCTKCGAVVGSDGICTACAPYAQPDVLPVAFSSPPAQTGIPQAFADKPTGIRFFCEYILGLIPIGLFVFTAIGFLMGNLYGYRFFQTLWESVMVLLPLCVGAALTVRARGMDLSLVSVSSLAAVIYGATGSVVVAVGCAVLVGAVSGALVSFLRLPPAPATLSVSFVLYGLLRSFTNMQTQILPEASGYSASFTLIALVFFAGTFVYHFMTGLGKSNTIERKAGTWAIFLAFLIAAICAAATGIMMANRLRVTGMIMSDMHYFPIIVMIWAVLNASRWFQNRVAPILCAVGCLLFWQILNIGLQVAGVSAEIVTFVHAVFALLFVLCAGFARWPFGKRAENT